MLLLLHGALLLTTFVGDDYPPSMVYMSNRSLVLNLSNTVNNMSYSSTYLITELS